MECIFCNIVNKTTPVQIVHEDEAFIAFRDKFPDAPIHILIIPKKHIESINHIEDGDTKLMGELLLRAKNIARSMNIADSGYRLSFNVGRGGGQLINHLHLHLMGGW